MQFIYCTICVKVLLTFLNSVQSARILAAVPTSSFSHQIFYRPLWRELAKRGHDIVLITTDPMNDPKLKNIREIDLSETYKPWNELLKSIIKYNDNTLALAHVAVGPVFEMSCQQLKHPDIQHLFKPDNNEHFDLIMMEYMLPTLFMFKHRYKAPMIALSSTDISESLHELLGNPTHKVLYPPGDLIFAGRTSFFGRLKSLVLSNVLELYFRLFVQSFDDVITETLGKGYPPTKEIETQVDMVFGNMNPLFSPIRPVSPATISIHGLHILKPKPLPTNLQNYLDQSPQGVIYMSLGSNVKSANLANDTRHMIMETFRQLPYNILWKFETDNLLGKPDNVKLVKWLPQQDVLRHKNVRAFVTQGGLQSVEEALYAAVPLVVIPFIFDQESNSVFIEKKGIGLRLDSTNWTVDSFLYTLTEVTGNEKYRNKTRELANLVQDLPMTPLERAVFWTEYVLRHKGAMHLHGAKLPWYQVYYIDVISFLAFLMAIVIVILYYLIKLLLTFGKVKILLGKKNTAKAKFE